MRSQSRDVAFVLLSQSGYSPIENTLIILSHKISRDFVYCTAVADFIGPAGLKSYSLDYIYPLLVEQSVFPFIHLCRHFLYPDLALHIFNMSFAHYHTLCMSAFLGLNLLSKSSICIGI